MTVKSNNCSWKLYTDDVLMHAYPSANRYESNPISFFKGTIAQLNIKIDNLPNEEIQDELDWTSF